MRKIYLHKRFDSFDKSDNNQLTKIINTAFTPEFLFGKCLFYGID